jgi:hypothetical protein
MELARPVHSSASPPPTSRAPAVRSATRPGAGQSGPQASSRLTRGQVQERAADTVLNAFSILGEVFEDFRRADRYFKYKALALLLWLGSVVGAFGVACPDVVPRNPIRAHLVVGNEGGAPVYMVENLSNSAWQDVEIVVDGRYRATLSQLESNGGVTLSPAVLFDADGHRAPPALRIAEIEVRVTDPEASVVLLHAGEPAQR